ncbi:MAG: 4-alpha-glucanotransferase [Candidatus Omnitrophica bacterium]|nr:4-alpha-glucanotransferase [Candidatus Omnitrophota bacterium]
MMKTRSSGILCHISSLPSTFGIGDLGPEAYRFVDFLSRSGQVWWQVLPLNPTEIGLGNSPYSSFSAFAFNTLFISPERLVKDGFLTATDIESFRQPFAAAIDFDLVSKNKAALIAMAFSRYQQRRFALKDFEDFCRHHSSWLDDAALFVVIKRMFAGKVWAQWPAEFRDRDDVALKSVRAGKSVEILQEKFAQYVFYRQWRHLQDYCSNKGIGIIGDIPIYVNYDSVDVWVHPELFKLDRERNQTFVAGVPPDYFSADGQRWGNPVYDWQALRATGFSWWVDRLQHNMALFDAVRVDHFRAFAQCWEIPAAEVTAIRGKWCDVPGMELFSVLRKKFDHLPIIAEDLGIITPDVDALKEYFGFPGMCVVMFAFHNDYRKSRDFPDNFSPECVVYTGTHDNNTVRGWFEEDMTPIESENFLDYFGSEFNGTDINWVMIGLAMNSVANVSIVPLQDVLGVGSQCRMNRPSIVKGNWVWRFDEGAINRRVLARLHRLTLSSNRIVKPNILQ